MSGSVSILGGFWNDIVDFITGAFAIIPQYIYFFYTCIASVLDLFQFVLRKLVGLDSYYVNGVETEGDMLSQFIDSILGLNGSYSALNTVFWSLIIFGAIVLVVGLIISLIKAHYNYNEKKSRPAFILGKGLKALSTFALVPLVTVFGIYISNILLKALDSITSSSSSGDTASVYANSSGNYSQIFKADEDEWGNQTYLSYDFFGSHAPTGHQSFSGLLFQAAAYNSNRVRYGGYTASRAGDAWTDCGIFNSNLSNEEARTEDVANMIDYAFANNLTLSSPQTASVLKDESLVLVSSFRFWQSAIWYLGTINFDNFSKYNVGLVWYYYNLWSFNYIIGFLGIIIAVSFMFNIMFGLVVRLIEATALFLCAAPVVSIMPLDDGAAFRKWRKEFVGDILMAYGAIIGINLLFMILPYLQAITFFDNIVLNIIMDMIFVIVGLLATKQIVALISNLVGSKDAYKVGLDAKKEAGKANLLSIKNISTVVLLGAKVAKFFPPARAAAQQVEKVAKKIRDNEVRKAQARKAADGMAEVSEKTHEAIRQQQIEGLEKQKEGIQEMQDAQKKVAMQERGEQDKYEDSAAGHDEKADEDAKNFENFLKSGATGDFDNGNEDDKKLAAEIKKEMEKNNAAHAASGKSPEDIAKLQEEELQNAVSKYRAGNSEAKLAQADRDTADEHKAKAEEAEGKVDEYQKQIDDIQKQIDDTKSAEVLDGYKIKKSALKRVPIPKNTINTFVKFSGDTLKAAGALFGFDEFIQQMEKETGLIEKGKMIMRDFTQGMGVNLSKMQAFQTAEEKEEAKKQERQAKLTVNAGGGEASAKYDAVLELEKTLKQLKYKKRRE